MHKQFWIDRWRNDHIGFHRDTPMPLMLKYWPSLGLPVGSRVLVPLAGKTLDMIWLASQGCRVLAVELSPLAIEQFLGENQLHASVHESPMGKHFSTETIEIIQGDVLALDEATLASCDAIYDRAAIIALPADMRKRYADKVYSRLRADCQGLMITVEYDQAEMDGPPFSVAEDEVRALTRPTWHVDLLERREILAEQPRFVEQGLSALSTAVYRLQQGVVQAT